MTTPLTDAETLHEHGWEQMRPGRWFHPLLSLNGRRRLYTEADAIAELNTAKNPEPEVKWPHDFSKTTAH